MEKGSIPLFVGNSGFATTLGSYGPAFLAGCLASIALYHGVLWTQRPSDRSLLWTGVLAVLGLVQVLFGGVENHPALVIVSAGAALAWALLVQSLYPTWVPRWLIPAVGIVAGAAVVSILVVPLDWSIVVLGYLALAGAEALVTVWVAIQARKRNPDAVLVLVAVAVFAVASVGNLIWEGLIPNQGLSMVGLVVALLLVSVLRVRGLGAAHTAAELSVAQLTLINRSLCRFLPGTVLGLLNKKTIVEVNLGDHCQHFLSVMFIDIRNFSQMSQSMGPEDNFRFLNSYLRRMGPVVRRHDGVVDRYLGDAILALFPGDPRQAIEAAIDLRRALGEYNVHRAKCGYQAIEVGIGIHRGPVLLGTIGENNRMEPTMISEAVNAASGLEGLTQKFGKDILVSGEAVEALGSAARGFGLEYLHDETIKGLSKPVRVYVLEPLAG